MIHGPSFAPVEVVSLAAGALHLAAATTYMRAHGRWPASATVGQLCLLAAVLTEFFGGYLQGHDDLAHVRGAWVSSNVALMGAAISIAAGLRWPATVRSSRLGMVSVLVVSVAAFLLITAAYDALVLFLCSVPAGRHPYCADAGVNGLGTTMDACAHFAWILGWGGFGVSAIDLLILWRKPVTVPPVTSHRALDAS